MRVLLEKDNFSRKSIEDVIHVSIMQNVIHMTQHGGGLVKLDLPEKCTIYIYKETESKLKNRNTPFEKEEK